MSKIIDLCALGAEGSVLFEDLDFAAALSGSTSDTGSKKKKTDKKSSLTQSEFQQCIFIECFMFIFLFKERELGQSFNI